MSMFLFTTRLIQGQAYVTDDNDDDISDDDDDDDCEGDDNDLSRSFCV